MPDWLKPILDFLKEAGKYLVPIAIVCALLLYLPATALDHFGLADWSKEYKPYFGITLLFCLSVIVWNALSLIWGWMWKKYRASQRVASARKRLHSLTEMEKGVLRGYIHDKTRTQHFELADGVIGELEDIGVLNKGTNIAHGISMDFNISDWAWDYLNEHPEALA